MNNQIRIKSDIKTLENLRDEGKAKYIQLERNKTKGTKKYIKNLLIFSLVFVVLSFINPPFRPVIFIYIILIIPALIYLSVRKYKELKYIRTYESQFDKFITSYKGLDFVFYNLYENKLEYLGYENDVYDWTEFLHIEDYGDSFYLFTGKTNRNIWIPKSAMMNLEDYEYFKNFAKQHIIIINPSGMKK